MPWTAVYMADGAYMTFTGATTADEVIRANTQFYEHGYSAGPRFVVFDFADIDYLEADRAAVDRVAAQDIVAAAVVIPRLVVAVVAPDLFTYGMSRLWEMQVAGTGWHTKIARSRPEAYDWLERESIPTDRFAALRA